MKLVYKLRIRLKLCFYISAEAILCDNDAFACKSGNRCIPKLWKCDGEHDCVDGSDEQQCGKNSKNHFPRLRIS